MGRLDTSTRDSSGAYERHITETVSPPAGVDLRHLLQAA